MNLEPSADQNQIAETFARFLDANSTTARVRAALPSGFDPTLWKDLGGMGIFGMRVPEAAGGLGLGLLDAVLVMEEAGRTLASGPLAEAIVTARLLASIGGTAEQSLLKKVMSGEALAVLALRDGKSAPEQWVAGAAVADVVIARVADAVVEIKLGPERRTDPNLASQPLALVKIGGEEHRTIAKGKAAVAAFEAAVEEWKLLMAAALSGLGREAIRLASAYACERVQFGQPIGTYQAISHPLADLAVYVDGSKLAVWSAIRAIADRAQDAAAQVSMALWLCSDSATQAVAQSLHTFGGYGLTLEYDIHLFNVRAKAWPLVLGDPTKLLREAGRRLYHGEKVALPDAGAVGIDFDYGDEARALVAETRAFFEANVSAEDRANMLRSSDEHDPVFHLKLAQAGLAFPSWPREFGGRGANAYAAMAQVAVWEEFNWGGYVKGISSMVGTVIRYFGSEEVKKHVLPRIVAGEATCALGFSEPGSGSDVFAAATRATRDGDGWRIDGQKMFTTGAHVSDYVLLLARTDPSAPKHKGLTTFLVPLKDKNVTIQAVHTFQDERTNITIYDGVRIPDTYRLGGVNEGLKTMLGAFAMEHNASFVGTHRKMLRAAERFCRETQAEGRPMIDDAFVYSRLARVSANVLASTMLAHRSLWASAERKPNAAFGPAGKLFSSERYRTDAADLLDLLAPASLIKKDGPAAYVNQCYRQSQVTTVYGGTSEVHRSMIAEKQLGLPRTRA
jgi:alkylation response protein AidB-like acyl-CoA dehydrogenase